MAKLESLPVSLGGLSFHEKKSIQPRTRELYANAIGEFRPWAEETSYNLDKRDELDCAFVDYFDHIYAEGKGVDLGRRALYGWNFYVTKENKILNHLPRAGRALKSWGKHAGGEEKAGIPYEAACRLAEDLWDQGHRTLPAMVLIHYDTYLRPHELLGMRPKDIFPPFMLNPKYGHLGGRNMPRGTRASI